MKMLKCDQCKKEMEFDAYELIGGFSSKIDNQKLDFCSDDCVIKYLTNLKEFDDDVKPYWINLPKGAARKILQETVIGTLQEVKKTLETKQVKLIKKITRRTDGSVEMIEFNRPVLTVDDQKECIAAINSEDRISK